MSTKDSNPTANSFTANSFTMILSYNNISIWGKLSDLVWYCLARIQAIHISTVLCFNSANNAGTALLALAKDLAFTTIQTGTNFGLVGPRPTILTWIRPDMLLV